MRPLGDIPVRYVLYALRATAGELADNQTGTTFGAISGPTLRAHPLPLPPLPEQHRIVAEIEKQLTRLDAAVAALERARANLKRYRASVLKAAVEGRLVEGGTWESQALGALLREPLRNGYSGKASSESRSIRSLTLTAVTRREFSLANTKMVNVVGRSIGDLWLQPGDIFIERSNTPELVGSSALYQGEPNWAIFPDLLIRVRVNDRVLPEFVDISLQTQVARRFFQSRAQGIAGSMPKIDQGTVEAYTISFPSPADQERIVSEVERRISIVNTLERALERGLKRAARVRQSVLKRAFEGRLVAQDPDDEPASVLLLNLTPRPPLRRC